MATEAQIKAQKKYDAENTRQVHLKLNRRTDVDVLEKLDSVPSKQGYIKELIRADIARGKERKEPSWRRHLQLRLPWKSA
jgi:hypothetical protein